MKYKNTINSAIKEAIAAPFIPKKGINKAFKQRLDKAPIIVPVQLWDPQMD